MNKAAEYIENVQRLIGKVLESQIPAIEAASQEMARALADGRKIFLFGTGHSNILAQEMFFRAGGLVNLRPIFEEGLMLHTSASKSSGLERLDGYAKVIFDHHQLRRGDILFVFSYSGHRSITVDMAQLANEHGLTVIALTNTYRSNYVRSPHPSGRSLYEFADITIENIGSVTDASIEIEGFDRRVGPTSTVVGSMIVNAIVSRTAEILVRKGITPEVFTGNSVYETEEPEDNRFIKKYLGEIEYL